MMATKKKVTRTEGNGESPGKQFLSALESLREEQKKLRKRIDRLEKQAVGYEEQIEILMKELIRTGCVNIGERRRILKRTALTQEALIMLLKKKGHISKQSLIFEMKKLREDNP